jgi:hypothetical protein
MGTGTQALGGSSTKVMDIASLFGIEVWGEQEVMYGNGASETK